MAKDLLNSKRIETLDGFRFVAIILVVLYHYYTRWTPPRYTSNLYPYGNSVYFFNYGYLGVQLFFVISGFVIAFTLQNTIKFGEFWKKRFIRLFPAMFICSVITFTIVSLLDTNNLFARTHEFKNFLVSLTFIHPEVFNTIFRRYDLQLTYINGSYWSLWPEIQFYVLASIVYFINPQKFFTRFFVITFLLYLLHKFIHNIAGPNHFDLPADGFFVVNFVKLSAIFSYSQFSLWFLLGVLFFQNFSDQHKKWTNWAIALIMGSLLHDAHEWKVRVILVLIFLAFMLLLFWPQALSFLNHKIITSIGLASYSLYLIHEYVGMVFITRYAAYFGNYSALFPLLVMGVLISFSLALYKFVEKPLGKFLKKKALKEDLV